MLAAIGPLLADRARPTSCSSTATRTRRSPAAWRRRRRASRSPTSRPGCARSTARCPRSSTACSPTTCPTCCCARRRRAVDNLERESVAGRVELVGDVMVDVAMLFQPRAQADRGRCATRASCRASTCSPPRTARATSTIPARLRTLVDLLLAFDEPVVLPLHPRTRARLDAAGWLDELQAADHVRAGAAAGLHGLHVAADQRAPRCSPTPAACRRRPTSPACRA